MLSMVMVIRGLLTNLETEVVFGRKLECAWVAASPEVNGMEERVVTVAGEFGEMAEAFQMIGARLALDSRTRVLPIRGTDEKRLLSVDATFVRLLVANGVVGAIIGQEGLTIGLIQGYSGAKIVALKEQLPFSNERIVEVHGSIQQIRCAVESIARLLVASWDKNLTIRHYSPCLTLKNGAIGDWLEPRVTLHYPGRELRIPHPQLSRPLALPRDWARLHLHFAKDQLLSLVEEDDSFSLSLDPCQKDPDHIDIVIKGCPKTSVRVYDFLSEEILSFLQIH